MAVIKVLLKSQSNFNIFLILGCTYFRCYGSGFSAGETIVIAFDTTILNKTRANSSGTFSTNVNIPKSALHGSHTIKTTGQSSSLKAKAAFLLGDIGTGGRGVPGNMLLVLGHTRLSASFQYRFCTQFLRNTLDDIMTG